MLIKPCYHANEVVYIKEALTRNRNDKSMPADYITYASDFTPVASPNPKEKYPEFGRPSWIWVKDKLPSMFMPAWAARDFIKILDVKPQRLQEITFEDCLAEGIHGYTFARGCLSDNPPDARWNFVEIWDSINPKYPWAVNPWDFRYVFKLVDREG